MLRWFHSVSRCAQSVHFGLTKRQVVDSNNTNRIDRFDCSGFGAKLGMPEAAPGASGTRRRLGAYFERLVAIVMSCRISFRRAHS